MSALLRLLRRAGHLARAAHLAAVAGYTRARVAWAEDDLLEVQHRSEAEPLQLVVNAMFIADRRAALRRLDPSAQ